MPIPLLIPAVAAGAAALGWWGKSATTDETPATQVVVNNTQEAPKDYSKTILVLAVGYAFLKWRKIL